VADRILIFPNTPWEADALVAVFSNGQARPSTEAELAGASPLFDSYYFPAQIASPQVAIPLASGAETKTVSARLAYPNVEVWCVSDLMVDNKNILAGSLEKARVLKYVADAGSPPTLVIAFGTAAFPDPHIYDGCVVIGSNVFNFSPKIDGLNPNGRWDDPSIGKFQDNSKQFGNEAIFQNLRGRLRLPIESRFLSPPISGMRAPFLLASGSYVAVSDVNVASVDDYAWADREAVQALTVANPRSAPGSVETTHGIIHAIVGSDQFLFVSAIANRLGYFNMEAAPRNYAQDFAVAHNGAVALAWLLPSLLPKPVAR
jgi:hypothetical protein